MTTKVTDWDRLAASSPVDRLAALCSVLGYSPAENRTEDQVLLAARNRRLKLTDGIQHDPNWTDLTGARTGRMTVVAWIGTAGAVRNARDAESPADGRDTTRRSRWLVRCTCGRYQPATTKTIKARAVLMCAVCELEHKNTHGIASLERLREQLRK